MGSDLVAPKAVYTHVQNLLDKKYSDYADRNGTKHGLNNGLTSYSAWYSLGTNPGSVFTEQDFKQIGDGDAREGRRLAQEIGLDVANRYKGTQPPGQVQWSPKAGDTYAVPPNPGFDNSFYLSNRELNNWLNQQ
jgi:hypothetical protein